MSVQSLQRARERIRAESSGDRPYSALMPANLITFAHFSVASEMIVPNSAGEPPTTVPPSSTQNRWPHNQARSLPPLERPATASFRSDGTASGPI